jgi:Restriction endonuclease
MYKPPKRRQLTKAERQAVYDKCGGHCAYCGCVIKMKHMQVDHVQPISVAGDDTLENMLPACHSCNYYKGAMPLYTFRAYIEKYPETLTRDSVTYRNAVRFGMVIPIKKKVVFYFEKNESGNTADKEIE